MSLSKLKANRQSFMEKINSELNKMNGGGFQEEDNRFWYPEVDKAGNGLAIIRFLPAPDGEDIPFVRIFSHSFQGPTGKWYIENSLTTIGKPDPVGEFNSALWDSGSEEKKEQARKQKRKLNYISNILVIKDSANPQNEGKVFLFKYGKKIFEKLTDVMNPVVEGDEPINPFDPWEGANFRLVIRKVDGYRNYDKSSFDKQTPIADSDEEIEAIWKKTHSLQEFLSEKNFKSYDELKAKLNSVLGLGSGSPARRAAVTADLEDEVAAPKSSKTMPDPVETEDDDDELGDDFFKELAKFDDDEQPF